VVQRVKALGSATLASSVPRPARYAPSVISTTSASWSAST